METIDTEIGPLQIVRAHEEDFDVVHRICTEAADWIASRGIAMWGWVRTDRGKQALRNWLTEHEVYVARKDQEAIGTLCLMWSDETMWGERGNDSTAGYIHAFAVSPRYAGRKIGAAMLDWVETRIAKNGRRVMRLDCMEANPTLCAYYNKLAFRNVGRIEGKGWSAALHEREIKPE